MGWLGESELNCPQCDGEGDTVCECCGGEMKCPECKGSGWDASKINIDAFLQAEEELSNKWLSSHGHGTCEWIEDGKRLGRQLVHGGQVVATVRASDFRFEEDVEDEEDEEETADQSEDELGESTQSSGELHGQMHLFD